MIATWPRSPAPTIRANAWWSARTRCWPKSAAANAPSCWPPPRRSSRASRPACSGRAVHCGAAAIGQAVGAVLGRRHMAKHFHIGITDEAFSFAQNPLGIAAAPTLDGIYVIRTNLPAAQFDAAATVRAYKSLSGVEHALRSLKTVDIELRAVFHWTTPRVRAHVLLCMLTYYLQWHMRRRLASMLFDEPDPAAREAQRTSPVAKAEPSPAAQRKAAGKRTDPADGEPLPVHSFHTLLGDLATLTRNVVRLGGDRLTAILATPTRTQHRALDLLGLTLTA